MNLQCVGCASALTGAERHCPQCGRPVDLDGNGLPDDLDRKVQQAVQSALAAEKQQAERAAAREAQAKRIAEVEEQLRCNLASPRTLKGLALRRFLIVSTLVAGLMLFGLAVPVRLLLEAFDVTLSGSLVCSFQCDGCRGPGRQFSWRYRGSWQRNKGRMGSALVCHNREIDVDEMQWLDVVQRNDELQPYIVHGVVVHVLDSALIGMISGVLFALGMMMRHTPRKLEEERARLEAELQALRAAAGS